MAHVLHIIFNMVQVSSLAIFLSISSQLCLRRQRAFWSAECFVIHVPHIYAVIYVCSSALCSGVLVWYTVGMNADSAVLLYSPIHLSVWFRYL